MPGGGKRSHAWRHFTIKGDNKDKAICHHCNRAISFKNGNIFNLTRHLKSAHPTVVSKEDETAVVFIQHEQTDGTFELEEEPNVRTDPQIAGSYRVKWEPKSETREKKRLRNDFKRIHYVERTDDDAEEFGAEELGEILCDDIKCRTVPTMTTTREPVNVNMNPPPPADDSDRLFLLSLLPLMKQLSPEDNLDIRIQIQNSFKEKLFPLKNPIAGEVIIASQNMH